MVAFIAVSHIGDFRSARGHRLGSATATTHDYYDYYPYYGSYDDYYGDSGCYIVRRTVLTPYGWRIRPMQVCG